MSPPSLETTRRRQEHVTRVWGRGGQSHVRCKGETRKIGIDRGLGGGTISGEQVFILKIGSEKREIVSS